MAKLRATSTPPAVLAEDERRRLQRRLRRYQWAAERIADPPLAPIELPNIVGMPLQRAVDAYELALADADWLTTAVHLDAHLERARDRWSPA